MNTVGRAAVGFAGLVLWAGLTSSAPAQTPTQLSPPHRRRHRPRANRRPSLPPTNRPRRRRASPRRPRRRRRRPIRAPGSTWLMARSSAGHYVTAFSIASPAGKRAEGRQSHGAAGQTLCQRGEPGSRARRQEGRGMAFRGLLVVALKLQGPVRMSSPSSAMALTSFCSLTRWGRDRKRRDIVGRAGTRHKPCRARGPELARRRRRLGRRGLARRRRGPTCWGQAWPPVCSRGMCRRRCGGRLGRRLRGGGRRDRCPQNQARKANRSAPHRIHATVSAIASRGAASATAAAAPWAATNARSPITMKSAPAAASGLDLVKRGGRELPTQGEFGCRRPQRRALRDRLESGTAAARVGWPNVRECKDTNRAAAIPLLKPCVCRYNRMEGQLHPLPWSCCRPHRA